MEFVLTEYLRMSGVYWGLTCLDLLGRLDALDSEKIVAWVLRCQARQRGLSVPAAISNCSFLA